MLDRTCSAVGAVSRCLTLKKVARYLGVGVTRVRGYLERGELEAINLGNRFRPVLRVTPEALAAFERRQRASSEPEPLPRRSKRTDIIDFYPD